MDDNFDFINSFILLFVFDEKYFELKVLLRKEINICL